jgi:hypothetical protein
MSTYRRLESVSCSETDILSSSESLVFRTGGVGLNIAMQVNGSKQPGSAPLSWIYGSTPASRRLKAERSKPRAQRSYPMGEALVELENLPCELVDTFDPRTIRESIEWLRHYLETTEDPSVQPYWLHSGEGRGRPFDRRECARGVFVDLANVYDFAGRAIERNERITCR